MHNQKIKEFIAANLTASITELLLKLGKDKDLQFAVSQISARQKIKDKLPSFYSNLDIILPSSIPLEQSSSEITALYKSQILDFDTSCDLTGGLGIDSIFLAKKSKKHIYIEQNSDLASIFKNNSETLFYRNIEVLNSDSRSFLKSIESVPNLIYMDPARRSAAGQKTYFLEDTLPNPLDVMELIKDRYRYVMIKTSPMLDISRALSQLGNVKEVHIVSVKNDCKELLFILERAYKGTVKYKTVNFVSDANQQLLSFEENCGDLVISSPKKYIYEANASISKLSFWKALADRFNLSALDINTHIYTSDECIQDFPGRVFELIKSTKINKKELQQALPMKKANISIKNVPLNITEFKKKTGIKEGGDKYIFVVKSTQLGNICLICKKVNFNQ